MIAVTARRALSILALSVATASVSTAQQLVPPPELPPTVAPGWTVTPSVGVAASWDDNVALTSIPISDQVTTVLSSLGSQYRGRHGQFLLEYRGMYDFYRQYSEFDAPDHRGRLEAQRRLNRHASLFARSSLAFTPTTEVPFADVGVLALRRRTTRSSDLRAGIDIRPQERTLITAAYGSQWVDLEADELVQPLLRGGYAHSGDLAVRRQVSSRVALGGMYEYQHAVVSSGEARFDIQQARGLFDVALSRPLVLSASVGYAWQTTGLAESQSAPTLSAELRYQAARTTWSLGYERMYLASFGFGGTVQNEEFRGMVQVPLNRYVSVSGSLAARENDPVMSSGLNLRSLIAQASADWTPWTWLRLEFYVSHWAQDTQVAGGEIDRNRFGVRLVTLHPMRLR